MNYGKVEFGMEFEFESGKHILQKAEAVLDSATATTHQQCGAYQVTNGDHPVRYIVSDLCRSLHHPLDQLLHQ